MSLGHAGVKSVHLVGPHLFCFVLRVRRPFCNGYRLRRNLSMFVNNYWLHLLVKTQNRCGPEIHSKLRPIVVLHSHLATIGGQHAVQHLSVFAKRLNIFSTLGTVPTDGLRTVPTFSVGYFRRLCFCWPFRPALTDASPQVSNNKQKLRSIAALDIKCVGNVHQHCKHV